MKVLFIFSTKWDIPVTIFNKCLECPRITLEPGGLILMPFALNLLEIQIF